MPNLDRDYYLDKAGLAQFVNEFETNIVAEEFSTSATYNLGDYCIYDNLLYVCIVPISTAGSWTGNTNWLQVLLADEVSEKTEIQTITLAQWEALTPEQKASGDYVISDATFSPLSASLMPYDNTTSGLTADDVQEAIDEVDNKTASDIEYSSGVTVADKLDSLDTNKLSKGDIRTLTGTGVTDANGIITSTALGIAQLDYIHHLILGVQSNTNGCIVNVGQYNQNFYYLCSNASNISVPMANTSVTITVIYMYK